MRKSIRLLIAAALVAQSFGASVVAESLSGSYLAARQAQFEADYAAAATYFDRALKDDPENFSLLEGSVVANTNIGALDKAIPAAQKLEAEGQTSQIARMALTAAEVMAKDWGALIARTEAEKGTGPLLDGLTKSWAYLGAGDIPKAISGFDETAEQRGLSGIANYHKALALAMIGDFASAESVFAGDDTGAMQTTRRAVVAHIQILSNLDRNADAIELIDAMFGGSLDPGLQDLRGRLIASETLEFDSVRSPSDGIAEAFYTIGAILANESENNFVLLYTRVAEAIRPDHVDAILLSAEILEQLKQYELAAKVYRSVPKDDGSFHAAELGRADTLQQSGKIDTAIEVLEQLAKTHPDLAIVHSTLGDTLRRDDRFVEATAAYDKALGLMDTDDRARWFTLYARAITHERQDNWPAAEADFRAALELEPEQPQVLNYLGYSLVEKQIKLDEALDMIERAVAARPNSGHIVDSLGWVLYRIGRYEEAVGHMERAAELMAVDPVVNDHLGDVYWAVGRQLEAEFQWNRALSFIDPEDVPMDIDPARVRRKLEVGLDKVLSEEGAPPLQAVKND